ncbi:MAG: hypothetical protein GY756_13605 [bacterium]|nr:hypothetical protein [bacterium]
MIEKIEKNIVRIIQITSIIYIVFILLHLVLSIQRNYVNNEGTLVLIGLLTGKLGFIVSALFYFGFAVLLSKVTNFIDKD